MTDKMKTKENIVEYDSLKIISDVPQNKDAIKNDNIAFGFSAYASALAEMIATKSNTTPFTIGVSGKWGSGKTTLMKAIQKELNGKDLKANTKFREIKSVWFQAWKYKDEEQILAALVSEIISSIKKDSTFKEEAKKRFLEKSKALLKRIDWMKLAAEIGKVTIGLNADNFLTLKEGEEIDIDLANAIADGGSRERDKYKEFLSFYDIFNKHFDDLLWSYLGGDIKTKNDEEAALVIFIDDLDRCPLPKIIHILETIKVFLDKKGCIFVIGAAKDVIQEALEKEEKYTKMEANRFLEKIIQIEFALPKKTTDNSKEFIYEIQAKLGLGDVLKPEVVEIILPILSFNPRRIKALFNEVALQRAILRHSTDKIDIPFEEMLFWRVLDKYNKDFVAYISEGRSIYDDFKESLNKYDELVKKNSKLTDIKVEIDNEKHFGYIQDKKIITLLRILNLDEWYDMLVSYTEKFEEPLPELESEGQLLEWIKKLEKDATTRNIDYNKFIQVEGSVYNMGRIGKKSRKKFAISKYPVTNIWFEEFMNDKGYTKLDYLGRSEEDKEIKDFLRNLKEKQPRYWDAHRFNQDFQPVVGISWYEAMAFCKWYSKKTGEKYYLPSEEKWQAAAEGIAANIYPWGNEWDKLKCNNEELGLNRTTVVGAFKRGETQSGIVDMSGNVWEWTRSIDGSGRVLCGGSWHNGSNSCRVNFRIVGSTTYRRSILGFRVAHSL